MTKIAPTAPFASNMLDVIDSTLYDRVVLEPDIRLHSEMRLFSTPIGCKCPYTGRVRTMADTNMYLSSQLHWPNSFAVERIGWLVSPTLPAPVVPDGYWELVIGEKWFARGPLQLSAGWGYASQAQDKAHRRGDPSRPWLGDGVELSEGAREHMQEHGGNLLIQSLQLFRVRLFLVDLSVPHPICFWCVLVGRESRSVQ